MPYVLDRETRSPESPTIRFTGALDDSDLTGLYEQMNQQPDAFAGQKLLYDMSEADGTAITSAGVRALATRPLIEGPSSRQAVVVRTELGVGMARMFELSRNTSSRNLRVFRDLEEARSWLLEDDS